MRAKAGDQLVTGSGCTGLIVDVLGSGGDPPYVVKWLNSGHIAMVVPDQYARVVPAENTAAGRAGPP
jgi:hypothetical protein